MFVIFVFRKLLNGHFLFAHVVLAQPHHGTTSFPQESCFGVSLRIPVIWCIELAFFIGQKRFYLSLQICRWSLTHIDFGCVSFFLSLSFYHSSHLLSSQLLLLSYPPLFHLLRCLLFSLSSFHLLHPLHHRLLPLFFFLLSDQISLFLHFPHFLFILSFLLLFFSFLLFLNSFHYFFLPSNFIFLISSYFQFLSILFYFIFLFSMFLFGCFFSHFTVSFRCFTFLNGYLFSLDRWLNELVNSNRCIHGCVLY